MGALAPRIATAGDAQRHGIVAATPDGTHVAFFDIENGDMKQCGLQKADSNPTGGLSNDQLHWLHRALWAFRGQYRFSDPKVAAYFALHPTYSPMSERRWRKLTADPAFAHDPDAPLVGQFKGNPSLDAITRAERARGIGKPAL